MGAALPGISSDLLECLSDVGVGHDGRSPEMPRAPPVADLEGASHRAVRLTPGGCHGPVVGRRSEQRVAELDAALIDRHDLCLLGWLEGRLCDTEVHQRSEHHRQFAGPAGSGNK